MKKSNFLRYCSVIISLLLFLITSGLAQTDISTGEVSGTWTLTDSPYHIYGEIIVPNDSTLTIDPGVEVVFIGHYKFNVQGRLLAIGTQEDSIWFTAEDTDSGWHGVRFNQTPNTNDTSKILYCSFKYGKANTGVDLDRCGGAILINGFDEVFVSNCLFEFNIAEGQTYVSGGGAILISDASPIITNCTFSNNEAIFGSAIWCRYISEAVIAKNVVSNNPSGFGAISCGYSDANKPMVSENIISNNTAQYGGGIGLYNSTAVIVNNIIIHNHASCGGGIVCYPGGDGTFINNTIAYNTASVGGAVFFDDGNYSALFINNILYGNTASEGGNQVYLFGTYADPIFYYNNVQGGKEGFEGSGAGFFYNGYYINNIDSDPLFIDAASDNYRLSDYSPCIGAGIAEISGHLIPPFCIYDTPRPFPQDTRPDIGACESLLGTPLVGVEQESNNPTKFVIYQNYPNPFNPNTKIYYSIPQTSFVILKVYDALGNQITTLVNEEMAPGNYEVEYNAGNLSSGIYFYQIKVEKYTQTKKMLLLQ